MLVKYEDGDRSKLSEVVNSKVKVILYLNSKILNSLNLFLYLS